MQLFTSCGVGTWGPPLRLGKKSEILLIEFV
jgi:predicted MPP superfamily phosphohydrolase